MVRPSRAHRSFGLDVHANPAQPAPVVLAALAHDRDGLLDSRIGRHAGRAQVIERAENVVVPERGKRELRPGLIRLAVFDHIAG